MVLQENSSLWNCTASVGRILGDLRSKYISYKVGSFWKPGKFKISMCFENISSWVLVDSQISELDIAFLISCKNWALYLIFMNMIIDSIRLSESRFHFYTFEFKSKKQVIHRIESYVLAVKINFDLWVNSILFHLFD